MNKKALLLTAAATTALFLSGCSTPSSAPRQEASNLDNLPHAEREYRNDISRANNIASAFGFGLMRDGYAFADNGISNNGSVALDSAIWAGNLHSAASSAFLPGTSSWGAAAGIRAIAESKKLMSASFCNFPLFAKTEGLQFSGFCNL